jgi:hypothetical protein
MYVSEQKSIQASIFKVGLAVFMPLFFCDVMLQDGYHISGHLGPILKGHTADEEETDCLTCNDEPDKSSQTLRNQLPTYTV